MNFGQPAQETKTMGRQCIAIPGEMTVIDLLRKDGRTCVYARTVAQIQQERPGAVVMDWDEWRRQKGEIQDQPGQWDATTKEQFDEAHGCLPPAASKGGAFLVGEPMDHHSWTGDPRFTCYKLDGGEYWVFSRPMRHAEFCALFGDCPFTF